ncbi:toll/interleukin-1 receptor domain-containing protein [Sphingomonas aerolata]|uniref:toll/interleukin-1 receptor domain-containing protein n=1 Tax=Sphingomonas aerolata TaxID=185951 RepID=UPI002FDF363B
MAITFQRNGRSVSSRKFFDGLKDDVIEMAIAAVAEDMHGKAAAIVDPETGKHAAVMVRRIGNNRLSIHADGSPAFARMLEDRLKLEDGEMRGIREPAAGTRLVYLAHATDDKAIAKPIAEGLRARGIEVWFDDWEIGIGDSLRQRMEQGLGDCTNFLVLLTPRSITRPWVAEEIDAGLMRAVEGSARFLGVRHELELNALSPFMRTRKTPSLGEGRPGSTNWPTTS